MWVKLIIQGKQDAKVNHPFQWKLCQYMSNTVVFPVNWCYIRRLLHHYWAFINYKVWNILIGLLIALGIQLGPESTAVSHTLGLSFTSAYRNQAVSKISVPQRSAVTAWPTAQKQKPSLTTTISPLTSLIH